MSYNGLIGKTIYDVRGSRSIQRQFLQTAFGIILGFCMAKLYTLSTPCSPQLQEKSGNDDSQQLSMTVGSQQLISNGTLADKLYNEVRVLCWIMTNPSNHENKARHVKRTWGKRCNKLLFMSSTEDETIGSIALNVSEGRDHLWAKTKEAFKYVYKHHFNDSDWFLKADDDTYTVVENLRFLLYPYSPKTPIYFGCKFKTRVKQGYMSGGAGYVLSKEAVRRFVEDAIPNPEICNSDHNGDEDAEIGQCLQNVNVIAGDSRDRQGRGRFFPFLPENHLLAEKVNNSLWYWNYIYYETDEGLDCCSNNAISFHYVAPPQMYVFDYILYHLRPFGHAIPAEVLTRKLQVGETEQPPMDPIDNVTELL